MHQPDPPRAHPADLHAARPGFARAARLAIEELTSGCNLAAASGDRRWREAAIVLERAGILLRELG
jgi:hypothetical protein